MVLFSLKLLSIKASMKTARLVFETHSFRYILNTKAMFRTLWP